MPVLSDLLRDRGGPAVSCDDVAALLAGVVDGTSEVDRAQRRHVEQCLRCQAELARYRKLLRTMRSLRTATDGAPHGLLVEILEHVGEAGERSAIRAALTGRRVAYLGGIAAAATAAGAGAAIVIVTRGRRGRLPLAG
jgi:anti-sigma factor RsiW